MSDGPNADVWSALRSQRTGCEDQIVTTPVIHHGAPTSLMYARGSPGVHALWGWMRVGAIHQCRSLPDDVARWAAGHPHLSGPQPPQNDVLVTADELEVGGRRLPGAGVFTRAAARTLTSSGSTRSVWRLPAWMHPDAEAATLSSTIKAWRTRVVDLLLKRANYTLTETSLILSGSGGYRLAQNITVEMAEAEPANTTPAPATKATPALPDGTRWNERQVAIAARLAGGETVRRKDLEAEFAVSDKTLKRDLTAMKAKGLALPQGNGSDHTWMAGPALKSRS